MRIYDSHQASHFPILYYPINVCHALSFMGSVAMVRVRKKESREKKERARRHQLFSRDYFFRPRVEKEEEKGHELGFRKFERNRPRREILRRFLEALISTHSVHLLLSRKYGGNLLSRAI